MKRYILIALLALGWTECSAIPDLSLITGDATHIGIMDTGDTTFKITDLDGTDDDVTGLLLFEFTGTPGANSSFIYDLDDPSRRITIFPGSAGVFDSVVLSFNLVTQIWDNGVDLPLVFTNAAGTGFGLGLITPGGTWFSQPHLNVDGVDHMLSFVTEGIGGLLGAFELAVAWEESAGGGDLDFNDHVFAATDITPFSVPTPGTLGLLGLALLGVCYPLRRG